MASTLFSSVLGLVRSKLIAHYFGAGHEVDAYNGAFELPDQIYYLLIGGVASTTFVKILTQFETEGREEDGDRALSNILNVMLTVLGVCAVLGLIFTPQYVHYKFHDFKSPETARLCVHMTRIMLLNPLMMLAGGVFASRLLAGKIFTWQALQPLLYNCGIITGAVLLHGRFGVSSLAIGAASGAFVGFFLINFLGARREGMRWTPSFDLRHPTLHLWVRMSLPLMLGQSLTTLDPYIRSYFASEITGAVAMMTYARQLFSAPMGAIGPAAGTASMPFFASLWAKGDRKQFDASVNRTVSRLFSISLLLSSVLIPLAAPLVDIMLKGGRFHTDDAASVAHLFVLFCLSMVFWASQNQYSRAFYAAGNTLTPMLSGTVVTVLSLPVYAGLFRTHGITGLIVASDIGIAAHTLSLAFLLNHKRMVRIAGLEWIELAKSLLASLLGGVAATLALRHLHLSSTRIADVLRLVAGGVVWFVVIAAVLLLTKSALPAVILRRKAKPVVVAEPVTEATDAPDR